MGDISEKLVYLYETKEAIAEAISEKGVEITQDTTFRQYAELIGGITGGGELQEGRAVPTGEEFVLEPDEEFGGFSHVVVEGDMNLSPSNIAEGVTVYGVTGSLKVGVSGSFPPEYEYYFEKARELYSGDYSDLMVLESNDYVTIGFLMEHFTVTDYEPGNTEFKAYGWYECAYDKINETWRQGDFISGESGGYNFVKNIRYASRYIVYGDIVLYPVNGWIGGVGDPNGAVAFLNVDCPNYYDLSITDGKTTLGSTFVPGQGHATFALPNTGTWSGLISREGATVKNFSVDVAPYIYVSSLFPEDKRNLAEDSWEQIAQIARGGNAFMYYNVGDVRKDTLTTGEVIRSRIIGFNHDTLADGSGFAGITLETAHCLDANQPMNLTNTARGGWSECYMRTLLEPGGTIYETMPQELRERIRPVLKLSEFSYAGGLITIVDNMFLLSGNEVGVPYPQQAGEGTIYDYYRKYAITNGGRIKKQGADGTTGTTWWLRSLYNPFSYISNVGKRDGYKTNYQATWHFGVSFAYCV